MSCCWHTVIQDIDVFGHPEPVAISGNTLTPEHMDRDQTNGRPSFLRCRWGPRKIHRNSISPLFYRGRQKNLNFGRNLDTTRLWSSVISNWKTSLEIQKTCQGPMVAIPHGTNRVGVNTPTLRTVCHFFDAKWTPNGKIVKSL